MCREKYNKIRGVKPKCQLIMGKFMLFMDKYLLVSANTYDKIVYIVML